MCEYRTCGYFADCVVLGISGYLVGKNCMLIFREFTKLFHSAVQSG